jgi:subtilisin family serine protease
VGILPVKVEHALPGGVIISVTADEESQLRTQGWNVQENAQIVIDIPSNQPPSTTTKSWALDMIDGAKDSTYTPKYRGDGVHIYILDSGLDKSHPEFENTKIAQGFNAVDGSDYLGDDLGHGTNVAGCAVGKTCGTAPNAVLHVVKIHNDTPTIYTADVIKGIDFLIANYKTLPTDTRAIVNISSGPYSQSRTPAVFEAISSLNARNITTVFAAGNSGANTNCNFNGDGIVRVGALNSDGNVSPISNYGICTEIFAPGDNIVAPSKSGSTYATLTGTSFAAPFVSGVLAQIAQKNPSFTPAKLIQALLSQSVHEKGIISLRCEHADPPPVSKTPSSTFFAIMLSLTIFFVLCDIYLVIKIFNEYYVIEFEYAT